MPRNKSTIHTENLESIKGYLESRSESIIAYIDAHKTSQFSLWGKNLTHSDLTNRGKRNGSSENLSKNYLYYLSNEEMNKIQASSEKPFESAKQSNIGMPVEFYDDICVPRLQRRDGPQTSQHEHIVLNDYVEVYLVNETIKYFNMEYTSKVLSALNKENKWANNQSVILSDGEFTPIQITQAIHGLGTATDIEFHKLRLSMFLNDTINILVEKNQGKVTIFIILEKNPRFFTIIGETNETWEKYLISIKNQERISLDVQQGVKDQDDKTRQQQSAWKTLLAKEMMNYTTHEGEVFCPFTQINADFDTVPMLFIASHIKRFVDSDATEAYDVNNGLLLCANADALFDKHMITVDENKKLKFSFLLENNWQLKQKLLLNQPIFELILNEKRMEYMAAHRNMFEEKELKRKMG